MICLLRKLLKAPFFYLHSFLRSKIPSKFQITILKNAFKSSERPSYLYFLLSAELIVMSAYRQFI